MMNYLGKYMARRGLRAILSVGKDMKTACGDLVNDLREKTFERQTAIDENFSCAAGRDLKSRGN